MSWRPMTSCTRSPAPRRSAGGRALLLTRRPRPVRSGRASAWRCSSCSRGARSGEMGPAEVRERYGVSCGEGGGLHRAAGRSVRRPARRARHRREDGRGAAARARDARGSAACRASGRHGRRREGAASAPARPRRCCEHDELLRTFKQIATLQRIDVAPAAPTARRDLARRGARGARAGDEATGQATARRLATA